MKNSQHGSIKRSEHIVLLSRDRHAGLLFCWKIREGLKKDIPLSLVLKYVNYFWEQHLKEHFLEEEILLFNRLNDELSGQGKTEHLMLGQQIRYLNHNESETSAAYVLFADLLTKHIRFEERILFPHLETALPSSVLISAGAYLSLQHTVPFIDNYPDEFWSKNYTSS